MTPDEALTIVDEDGEELVLDTDEATSLRALTRDFDAATVSACPGCASRVLACVALVDLLRVAPPHPRGRELADLADDAPTLHLYVHDGASDCRHPGWRDPGFNEWSEVLDDLVEARRGIR